MRPPLRKVVLIVAWLFAIALLFVKGGLLGGLAVTLASLITFPHPHTPLFTFWVLYVLQTTVLEGVLATPGLYYSLYAVIALWAIAAGIALRREGTVRKIALLFGLFYAIVLIGAFHHPAAAIVNVPQRLLIYGLGLCSALLLIGEHQRVVLLSALSVSAVVTSLWVMVHAVASGFAYRGVLTLVNPNYVALVLALGLLPLVARLLAGVTDRRLRLAYRFATYMIAYASLTVASRGVLVAVLSALVLVVLRENRGAKWMARVAVEVLAVLLVGSFLPGSNAPIMRFIQEPRRAEQRVVKQRVAQAQAQAQAGVPAPPSGSQLVTPPQGTKSASSPTPTVFSSETVVIALNDRWPIWQAGVKAWVTASFSQKLLGSGVGAAEIVVNRTNSALTSMHNAYLQLLVDYGVLGLAAYLLILANAFARNLKDRGYVSTALLGLLAVVAVAGLTADVTDTFLHWMVLGLATPLIPGAWALAERKTQKRKLTFLVSSFGIGGAERQLYGYVVRMPAAVDLHMVYFASETDNLLSDYSRIGVAPQFIDRGRLPAPIFVWCLYEELLGERPDAVHAYQAGTPATLGRLAALLTGVPAIIQSDRALNPVVGPGQRLLRPVFDSYTKLFLTNAEAIAVWLGEKGLPCAKLRVIPNGVDLKPFDPTRVDRRREDWQIPEFATVLGFLGKFRPEKRIDLLLDAVLTLPEAERPDYVVLGGAGDLFEEVRTRTQRHEWLQAHCRLLGLVTDVPGFMAGIDYLVLSSDYEGTPNVVLEAMAMAKPVVATRVSDVPLLVGENGFLAEPGNVKSLAEAISRMQHSSQDVRMAMGRAARENVVSRYEINRAARDFWNAQLEVLR